MRWAIISATIFFGTLAFAATQVAIQGTKVVIQADVRINALEFEVKGSSSTGQCMGLMCAITYPN